MNIPKTVGQNTIWQVGSKLVNGLSGLLIIGIVSRTFGSSGVGMYTLILSYVGFFFIPVDFGLNAIAVKHLLDEQRNKRDIFNNLLGLRIVLGIIAVLIAIGIAIFLPYNSLSQTGYSNEVKLGILLASLTIFAQAILATSNAFFQAHHKYNQSFIANLISALFNTVAIIIFTRLGLSFMWVIVSFSISGLVGATSSLLLVKTQLQTIKPLREKKYWSDLIKETLPLTTSLLINLIYFRADSLLLPLYRDLTEVGHYNVAYKVFDNFLVIPNYFTNALYPVLLLKWNEGYKPFIKIIKKSLIFLTATAIAVSLGGIIIASPAVQIISGYAEPKTILYLQILSAGLLSFFLSSIVMWSLIVIGKQKYLTFIYGSTMIINILLNIFLIPTYGAQASAYITIITEVLVLLMSGTLFLKSIYIDKIGQHE